MSSIIKSIKKLKTSLKGGSLNYLGHNSVSTIKVKMC